MPDDVYALVLAGGRGSRFWPLSRQARPKQCLALDGDHSLLAQTLSRISALIPHERSLVLTGPQMEAPVRAALPALDAGNFLIEPSARNTAPCIAWGTLEVENRAGGSAIVVVLPADHRVGQEAEFRAALEAAVALARDSGDIVTLGVRPDRAETGYGYLELGPDVEEGPSGAREVRRFCEKPDRAHALEWLQHGQHLWNAGIFVFRVDAMLREIATHLPGSSAALGALRNGSRSLEEVWEELEATSIDYGLMEKCERILTIPLDVEWSDLGDWEAVGRHLPDTPGGKGVCEASVSIDSQGCVVHAPGKVVALVGVEDLIVVSTPDAILVMPRSQAQKARSIPAILEDMDLSGYT
jgi:mannose-1-phosphate guanylyltransferase